MTNSRLVRPSFRASKVSRSSTASGKRTDFVFSSILTIYPSLPVDVEPEPAPLGRMPRRSVLHVTVGHQFRTALMVGGDGTYPREAHELPAAGVEMAMQVAAIVVVEQRRDQPHVRGQHPTVIAYPFKVFADCVLGYFPALTHCRGPLPAFAGWPPCGRTYCRPPCGTAASRGYEHSVTYRAIRA